MMSDESSFQGVVLSSAPVGEYDRRVVILTRERGKISAFARGARRMGSQFLAVTGPFVFGTFSLYEGRDSYRLTRVSVSHSFPELAAQQPGIYYGYYFLEIADYFGREGIDATEQMNLLYVSAKALLNPAIDDRLVQCIYELRVLKEQGVMPGLFACMSCHKERNDEEKWFFSRNAHGILCEDCVRRFTGSGGNHLPDLSASRSDLQPVSEGALQAMRYIVTAPVGRLYTFMVGPDILGELERFIHKYFIQETDKTFKSLRILETMQKLPE